MPLFIYLDPWTVNQELRERERMTCRQGATGWIQTWAIHLTETASYIGHPDITTRLAADLSLDSHSPLSLWLLFNQEAINLNQLSDLNTCMLKYLKWCWHLSFPPCTWYPRSMAAVGIQPIGHSNLSFKIPRWTKALLLLNLKLKKKKKKKDTFQGQPAAVCSVKHQNHFPSGKLTNMTDSLLENSPNCLFFPEWYLVFFRKFHSP